LQLFPKIRSPGVEVTPSPSGDGPRRVLVIGGIAALHLVRFATMIAVRT
jgi:hypothetical protein